MGNETKIIEQEFAKIPQNMGDYDELVQQGVTSFGVKERVNQYGCEFESIVENNTYAPATLVNGKVTPDTTHWRLVTGIPGNYGLDGKMDALQQELNTEKQKTSTLEEAVGTGGSVDSRISAAVNTEASRAQAAEEQLRQAYEALSQSQPIPVTELPATGEAGKIYRLAGTTSYADYMYAEGALNTPIKMAEYNNAIDDEPTVGSENLVKSKGVFNDINSKITPTSVIVRDEQRLDNAYHYLVDSNYQISIYNLTNYIGKKVYIKGHLSAAYSVTCEKATVEFMSSANVLFTNIGVEQDVDFSYIVSSSYPFLYVSELKATPLTKELYISIKEEVDNIKNNIDSVIIPEINSKVEKEYSPNIIDPTKLLLGKYITAQGIVTNSETTNYSVSDMIPVNGHDIISNAFVSSYAKPYVVYDENGGILRVGNSTQYTYQNGDSYIRFGFVGITDENFAKANYGTILNDIRYSDYAPIAKLDKEMRELTSRVNSLDGGDVTIAYLPNKLYKVYNDIYPRRQNVAKLGLSRILPYGTAINNNATFKNKKRFLPLIPENVSVITESQLDISVTDISNTVVVRNTPASLGVNIKPRILIIGDSVTNGTGSDSNRMENWYPLRYFSYAKMYFEMDKIDNNNVGHDILFVGGSTNGDSTIQYKGITRDIKAKAEAGGGNSLSDLFVEYSTITHNYNRFYDDINDTFSVIAFLSNYRTMDDLGVRLVSSSPDPHGENVTGSDGRTYTIGQRITSQELLINNDICTPTHIFINLNHNTSTSSFNSTIGSVVNIIKTELPDVVFAWLSIDATGTFFPKDYPNFDQDMITMTNLHLQCGSHYNYFHNNIEDEANNIYLLGMNFIQPEAIDYPYIDVYLPNGCGEVFRLANEGVAGRAYHPNNIAHMAYGYELYAFIKWLISK